MLQIHQLQQCIRTKRKQSQIKMLQQIIIKLQSKDKPISMSLIQKGIIMELLTKLFYQDYEIFTKQLLDFYGKVQGGDIILDSKTVKKRRITEGIDKNTTAKRKKKITNIQMARNGLSLDQMLQIQLSSPTHIQPRSQYSEGSQKQKQIFLVSNIDKIEIPSGLLNIQQFLTPLKSIIQQKEQRNLDELRELLEVPNKQKSRTKNKQNNTRTRKKGKQTQHLQQQINVDISLNLTSQVSIRKQIEDILEVTKKKKTNEKQNLFHHQLFAILQQKPQYLFANKDKISLFCHQNYEKFSKRKIFNQRNNSQNINSYPLLGKSIVQESFLQDLVFSKKAQKVFEVLDDVLSNKNQTTFDKICKLGGKNKQDKAVFFYDLLCNTEKYTLYQQNLTKFSQIKIFLSQA